VFGRELVGRFLRQLDPTNPVLATIGDDLELRVVTDLGAFDEVAAVLPQQREPAFRLVLFLQPERYEQIDELCLDRRCVDGLVQERVRLRVRLEDLAAVFPGRKAERLRPIKTNSPR
jgi:hypothetical protein